MEGKTINTLRSQGVMKRMKLYEHCLKALSAQLHCYASYVVNSYGQGQATLKNRPLMRTFQPRTNGVLISGFYCNRSSSNVHPVSNFK